MNFESAPERNSRDEPSPARYPEQRGYFWLPKAEADDKARRGAISFRDSLYVWTSVTLRSDQTGRGRAFRIIP